MIRNDDIFINRRTNAHFWDDWKNNLKCALKNFEAQSAEVLDDNEDKDNEDKRYIERVHTLLKNALIHCMKRYSKVLDEQLNAFKEDVIGKTYISGRQNE